jgi:hypothetical protein
VRSRIAEAINEEVAEMVPGGLCVDAGDMADAAAEGGAIAGAHTELPKFLEEHLRRIGAQYRPERRRARTFEDATPERNLVYLGTYFPRSVIESWNIWSELLRVPAIDAAFRQKDVLRVLDLGSGTGGAIVGLLLALHEWNYTGAPVEVVPVDHRFSQSLFHPRVTRENPLQAPADVAGRAGRPPRTLWSMTVNMAAHSS